MNKERKDEILMNIIPTDVENAEEILDAISEPDDEKCLRMFYQKIIDGSTYTRGFKTVGNSILKQLCDEEWAKEVYQMAADKAKDSEDYLEVAHSYAYYLKDMKLAKDMCIKAANIAKTAGDYIDIVYFEENFLNDKSNSVKYLEKAEDLLDGDIDDQFKLGLSYLASLGDVEKAGKLIRKSIEETDEVELLCTFDNELSRLSSKNRASFSLYDDLYSEIGDKIEKEAFGTEDYLCIAEYLDDNDAIENAISAADSTDDYLAIAEHLQENNEDPSEMFEKALEEADPDDAKEIAKIKEAMK